MRNFNLEKKRSGRSCDKKIVVIEPAKSPIVNEVLIFFKEKN